MKKVFSVSKRALALILSFLMVLSLCVVSVSAFTETIPMPRTGVILYDDFESYSTRADSHRDNGGPYNSCAGGWPVSLNGNKVWATQVQGAYSTLWYANNRSGAVDLDSGKVSVSATVQVASGYKGTATGNLGYYPSAYIGIYVATAQQTYPKIAFANTSNSDTSKGGAVSLSGNYSISPSEVTEGTAKTFSADTPHTIAMVLDYDQNKTFYYLDGVLLGEKSGATRVKVGDEFGLLADIVKDENYPQNTSGTVDRPYIYVDDFRIERLGSGSLEASALYKGDKKVEVTFSAPVGAKAGLSASSISVKDVNSNPIAVSSYAFNNAQDKLTINLASELTSGQGYFLDLGQGKFFSIPNPSVVYNTPNDKIFFTVALSESVVLDQDFDSVTFPVNSTDGKNVSWMDMHVSTGTDNGYTNMSDWGYYYDGREYEYVAETTVNQSDALRFTSWMPFSRSQSSQNLVLPFSKAIKGGTVTVEFDAAVVSDYGNRFAFGLRDTENTVTAYNPWQSWGNATYFGGLTYWSGAPRKALMMNSSDKPNMLPDGYLYYNTPGSSNYSPGGGKWGDHSVEVTDNFVIPQDASNVGNEMKTWKYVIDLDNQNYSFYLDGELKGTLDYLPGGESGTYDAFVATITAPSGVDSYGTAGTDMSIYLDNVKVSHKYDLPTLNGAKLFDYQDQDITLANGLTNITTGTLKAVLVFSIPMDQESAESEIKVYADKDIPGYEIEVNRNRVTINFPEGLAANAEYTIETGNIKSANGHAIVLPKTYTFTTDAGVYAVSTPSMKVDGSPIGSLSSIKPYSEVTAEVTFLNTAAGTPRGGVLYLAAYKDDELLGAKTAGAAATAGVHRVKITADATNDGFYGADKLRLFMFDNVTDLQPQMASIDFPGSYAAATFSNYNETLDASEKSAIVMARLGSDTAPVKETQAGRTGWRLDASSSFASSDSKYKKDSYIAVDLSPTFTEGLDTDEAVKIEVDYYDDSYGGFAVIFSDHNGEMQGEYQQMSQTNTWRTATFTFDNASFANDFHGVDFAICASDLAFRGAYPYMKTIMGTSPVDVLIGAVRVSKVTKTVAPYDITVDTDYPGNVFIYGTYGTTMTFDITYDDPKGNYSSGTAKYTVKDYNGVTKLTKTQNFTGGKDILNIAYSELPLFGLYTLEIEVSGNNISQKKIVDFASSLKGATNLRYGTNTHYDWRGYTQQEIKDQIDMVYNAGIGITRSKIFWNDVQKTIDGAYQMPDNVKNVFFANQYLDELGLENLCIIDQQNWAYVGDSDPYHWMTTEAQREDWAAFCAWVVDEENLGAYTKYFSISNEFNLQGPGGMHPYDNYQSNHNADNYPHYVNLVKAAYPAIKAANSNAVVITGEIGRFEDEWINECYNQGLADYTDVVSFHAYETMTGPEYYKNEYVYENAWDKYLGNDPIEHVISPWAAAQEWYKLTTSHKNNTTGAYNRPWLTEIGYSSRIDSMPVNIGNTPATDSQQAKWIVRNYALLGYEVDKLFHYAFTSNNTDYFDYENNFGIVRAHDYRTPYAAKPAYIAVATLNHFTGGPNFGPVAPTYIGSESDYRERGYRLNYASSQNFPDGVIMAWKGDNAGTKTTTFSISGAKNLYVYDMYGNWKATIANGASYTLTPEPVYVVKAN